MMDHPVSRYNTAQEGLPVKLHVTRPDGGREFDETDTYDVADEEAADALLGALPCVWHEAVLRTSEGDRRRFPRSGWCPVREWPTDAAYLPPLGDDAAIIAAWLRAMGVRVTWPDLLRAPWPGHERGDACGATCLPPDESLRSMRRKGYGALESAVGLVLQEGIKRGMVAARDRYVVDVTRRMLDRSTAECAELERRLRDARNEIRRLKGEPEVSEEQERDEARARVRALLAARKEQVSE